MVISMLKELSEDLNSIKKDPGRNEGYANWNKEQLQGNNSRVDEAKNQINDLNEDSVSSLWDTSSMPTFTSQECQKEKRKSKKLEIYLKK